MKNVYIRLLTTPDCYSISIKYAVEFLPLRQIWRKNVWAGMINIAAGETYGEC